MVENQTLTNLFFWKSKSKKKYAKYHEISYFYMIKIYIVFELILL